MAPPALALAACLAWGGCFVSRGDALEDVGRDVIEDATVADDSVGEGDALPEDVGRADEASAPDVFPDASPDVSEEDAGGGDSGDDEGGADAVRRTVRQLTEAEGRALIRAVIHEATGTSSDPCHPTLDERIIEDVALVDLAIRAELDLYAPVQCIDGPDCGRCFGVSGFEFLTDEAGDDEEISGDPDGFTDAEAAQIADLRRSRAAGVGLLRAADYSYVAWAFGDGEVDDGDKARAEELLRAMVRTLIAELVRDGLI
jgi:hypothetical protein